MANNIRFYMTVEREEMKTIDELIEKINESKAERHVHVKRQSFVRGLITFALSQPIRFTSGYTDFVIVRLKE